jgi:maleate isomerase
VDRETSITNPDRPKRIRIGVLTPHFASGPEEELPTMDPERVITCVARVSAEAAGVSGSSTSPEALRALTASPLLDDAADVLGSGTLDVIVFSSTSSAFTIGCGAETALVSRLSLVAGVRVLSTCASALLALRTLGVERMALVNPPWFDAELNHLGATYFEDAGLDVLSAESALDSQDVREVEAEALSEWMSRHVSGDAEAIFIGGNGLRAAGAIAALEARLGRTVLTSNQVLLWNVLAEVGATPSEVRGYGRLFQHSPRPAPLR